jgi:hypothetical protein
MTLEQRAMLAAMAREAILQSYVDQTLGREAANIGSASLEQTITYEFSGVTLSVRPVVISGEQRVLTTMDFRRVWPGTPVHQVVKLLQYWHRLDRPDDVIHKEPPFDLGLMG